jgi:hypothetical protein
MLMDKREEDPVQITPNKPYTQRFIPRAEAKSWDPDGVEAVHCPVCGGGVHPSVHDGKN